MEKGFTLLEVLIIAIIVGILATFAMPQYAKIREKSLDNEAKGYLISIVAAEKIFKSERNAFYASAVHKDLNDNLEISLPLLPPADEKWNYSAKVYAASGSNPETVCVQAERNLEAKRKRYWRMYDTDLDEPQALKCSS